MSVDISAAGLGRVDRLTMTISMMHTTCVIPLVTKKLSRLKRETVSGSKMTGIRRDTAIPMGIPAIMTVSAAAGVAYFQRIPTRKTVAIGTAIYEASIWK